MTHTAFKAFLSFFLFLLLSCEASEAQFIDPLLDVRQEKETDAAQFLKNISALKADTNKVSLLLKASHIYWEHRSVNPLAADSCLNTALAAQKLSLDLQYARGKDESGFMIYQVYLLRDQNLQAAGLIKASHGEQRVRLMILLANYYLKKKDATADEFSKAFQLITQATAISNSITTAPYQDDCRIMLAKYYLAKGEIEMARKTFLKNIKTHQLRHNYALEARNWSVMAHIFPENEDSFHLLIHYHEMAVDSYLRAGDKKQAANELRDLAVVNTNHNQTKLGGKQLLRSIAILESVHEKVPRHYYYLLAEVYRFTGLYHQALYYGLKALQTPEYHHPKRMLIYRSLGETYAVLGDVKNGLKYYQILFDHQLREKSGLTYVSAYRMGHIRGEAGQPVKALSELSEYIKLHPPENLSQKQLFISLYGDLYRLSGQNQKAEEQYKKMLALDDAVKIENGKKLKGHEINVQGSGALFLIGRFYGEQGRYRESKKLLERSIVNPQYFDVQQEMETYKFLFKADSAQGDYITAIRNLQRYKLMSDSINSLSRNNQLTETNIRYQTGQKEKDIKVLESKQKAQQAELMRAATVRNVILGGAAALLLLTIMAFTAFRIKQRSNRRLFAQQQVINDKNTELQALLSEKEVFLKEKEWLLKEVHHRVKNNLQIVMSLLSTQSFYLQSESAREAILLSENRVQSIALIHQKLYTGDNLASISMPAYISDLVMHLSESFSTAESHISFQLQIAPVSIDLSQAVPVGLILNEAITNAIKYAFNGKGGQISVMLRMLERETVEIAISDNGKGLPNDFDMHSTNSLGMEMMQGLTAQLKGNLEVVNSSGTAIVINFRLVKSFPGPAAGLS
ncbi:histidine kinase dimerization/phosphoacceptor domain -containing protein [Mucilaginibacter lutimaris]|uniref:histidine kinase n=1 Tax=Mucilaginibacter lutimaris TaxID=931629 RepID=A0ABW2ZEH5_9SPHI